MRCKNCHTAMMDDDLACPSCRTPAARALALPPGPSPKPDNLAVLFPLMGGAVGGLIYGAILAANSSGPAPAATGSRGSGATGLKQFFGGLLLLGAALFIIVGCVQFRDTWQIVHRPAKTITAAELRALKGTDPLQAVWLAYTFEDSQSAGFTLTRARQGIGGEVKTRGLLVEVDNKWLLASVAPGFDGNRLVGLLVPLDAETSKRLQEKTRGKISPSSLLPYEFMALDGCPSDQHIRFGAAGMSAAIGLVALFLGLWMVWPRRRFMAAAAPAASLGSFLPASSQ
jgi:hypothetical protein